MTTSGAIKTAKLLFLWRSTFFFWCVSVCVYIICIYRYILHMLPFRTLLSPPPAWLLPLTEFLSLRTSHRVSNCKNFRLLLIIAHAFMCVLVCLCVCVCSLGTGGWMCIHLFFFFFIIEFRDNKKGYKNKYEILHIYNIITRIVVTTTVTIYTRLYMAVFQKTNSQSHNVVLLTLLYNWSVLYSIFYIGRFFFFFF